MPVMLFDHDARGLDQAGTHQRRERQGGGGDVAAGRGHQRCAAQLVAVQFGQAVHGLRQQLGLVVRRSRTSGGYSDASFSRYAAERSTTQPTRPTSCGRQRHARPRAAGRGTPGRGPRPAPGRTPRTPGRGTARRGSGYSDAARTPAWESPVAYDHLEVGVLRTQPQQFGTGVARCTDDAHSRHRRMTIQGVALSCNRCGVVAQPPRWSSLEPHLDLLEAQRSEHRRRASPRCSARPARAGRWPRRPRRSSPRRPARGPARWWGCR